MTRGNIEPSFPQPRKVLFQNRTVDFIDRNPAGELAVIVLSLLTQKGTR